MSRTAEAKERRRETGKKTPLAPPKHSSAPNQDSRGPAGKALRETGNKCKKRKASKGEEKGSEVGHDTAGR